MDEELLPGWLGEGYNSSLIPMKSIALLLTISILLSLVACQQEEAPALLIAHLRADQETQLSIDGQSLELSETGSFIFTDKLEQYTLYDVSYGQLEWPLFLSPGAQVEIHMGDGSLEGISYTGDLAESNTYLLSTVSLTAEINSFLNESWVALHSLGQEEFISEIDSLKALYKKHLDMAFEKKKPDPDFLEAWSAEIEYALNALVLHYPERYMHFPPTSISLDEYALDYLKSTDPDRPEYFNLTGYKRYTRAWIDYHATQLAEQDSSEKHYGLKKMDFIFNIISSTFKEQELRDYWKSEFLVEHLENNRLPNAQPYLEFFLESARGEADIARVLKARNSQQEANQDHTVSVYKTENGFRLAAHLFSPEAESLEKRAAIVLFHGGGWNGGNPSWGFGRARHFAENGMLAVAAQYRLANKHDITAVESMADARDLMIWLRAHADSLHIDPDKIVGYGWSAGAHLISSAAIFPQTDQETGISSAPDALVLLSPAVSLPRGERWKYWNYNVLGTKARVDEVDPVEHVKEGLPPTIILQGRDDTVTPLDGVQLFYEEMNQNGNLCELWVYDNVGHLFTPSYMPDNGWPRPDKAVQEKAFNQIDLFLKEQGYLN